MSIPVVLSWSGGKDSALALDALQKNPDYDVVALLTTLTRDYQRISMHGVRRELLLLQAKSTGLPLTEAWIRKGAGNTEYEQVMTEHLSQFAAQGICTVAFGDLFLEDIRAYRERMVKPTGMTPLFPIWLRNTTHLASEFVRDGFRARTCCVDTSVLAETFCGRELSSDFFADLPDSVDPCGENGEFHTFVYDGPPFLHPIDVTTGETNRDGPFTFCDITKVDSNQKAQND